MTESSTASAKERRIDRMTRKDFDLLPHRVTWNMETIYDTILLFPTKRKHDSGYACMMIVGVVDGHAVEIAANGCDDICWHLPAKSHEYTPNLRNDCILKNGGIHFHGCGNFKVGRSLSSIDITFICTL